jgi:hypothetical protein
LELGQKTSKQQRVSRQWPNDEATKEPKVFNRSLDQHKSSIKIFKGDIGSVVQNCHLLLIVLIITFDANSGKRPQAGKGDR